MIDADDVAKRERLAHALHPPVIAAVADRVPTIKRISPALPGLAEGIGWNPGDIRWTEVWIQVIKVGMSPHVSAVITDEDRDIPDDLYAAAVGGFPHRAPLLE